MNQTGNDRAHFKEQVVVEKSYQKSVLVEGKTVPIIHQFGHNGTTNYPKLRVKLAEIVGKVNQKVFGIPYDQRFFGTESITVEKFKEVYSAGIGNNAVDTLAKKGYGYRQICSKIGLPVLREIHITHAIKTLKPYWINLMLNEGIDIIWDLITEGNAVDYYTNALARVGVGNSSTAAMATDTGLIGGSTAFEAMEATFPLTTTAQRIDLKGSFASGVAEFAWEEFTTDNGSSPNDNLQRLVTPKGTKSAGETWTAEIRITGS